MFLVRISLLKSIDTNFAAVKNLKYTKRKKRIRKTLAQRKTKQIWKVGQEIALL